jgi:hypothetical protein
MVVLRGAGLWPGAAVSTLRMYTKAVRWRLRKRVNRHIERCPVSALPMIPRNAAEDRTLNGQCIALA